MKTAILLTLGILTMTNGTAAQLKLPAIISDHMVIQRGVGAPVWGWGKPGAKVVVKIEGHARGGEVAADGRWLVRLPAKLKAGGPYQMTVFSEGETIVVKDILVGEVWLNSGQSNMEWSVERSGDAAQEIAAADWPEIRLFHVPRKNSSVALENTKASWQICSPETIPGFSAVAYYFGRELHKELAVPVGLIESAWGGTPLACWLERAALAADADYKLILERGDRLGKGDETLIKDGVMEFDLQFAGLEFVPKAAAAKPLLIDDFKGAERANALGGSWGEVNTNSAEPKRFEAGRFSGSLKYDKWAAVSSNLSADGGAVDLSAYEGLRFKVKGVGQFCLGLHQPSITDWDSHRTAAIQGEEEWREVTIKFADMAQGGWGETKPFTPHELDSLFIAPSMPSVTPQEPSGLFNGMIMPVVPYGVRGFTWYQGETNVGRAYQYRKLLKDLVKSWRVVFVNEAAQFLVVQLANWRERQSDPEESDWAELREAQAMVLELPGTGLAVTMDIGEANDVHPANKQEVGRRLALWALGTTYGKDIVYSGPLYESMKVDGNEVRLSFKHSGGGLEAKDGGLKAFALAGQDKKWHWAEAEIEGETVVVSSKEVKAPVAVRYNWGDNPGGNLYNKQGLPAAPCRTDDWEGLTDNNK